MDKGQFIATAVLSAAALIKIIPQTIGLSKYKEFLQFYNGTEPGSLDEQTNELLEECLYKINIDPYLEMGFQPFVAYGQDVLHKGTLHLKTGAIVGLPYHFRYTHLSQIDQDRLTIKNKPINWESEHGQNFANSLILSENAKKFAIAREIYYVLDQHVTSDGALMLLNFGGAYCAYFALRELYQLKHRVGLASRMTILGALSMVAAGTYSFMLDIYQRRRDLRGLHRTSQLGDEFVSGGIEFYDKLLQRNASLYHLLGNDGPKAYTLSGNERISFRMKNLPISNKRNVMKEILAEKSKEKEGKKS